MPRRAYGAKALRRPPRGGRGLKYQGGKPFRRLTGRPPRGGRGLKSNPRSGGAYLKSVALLAEGVD